MNGGGWVAWKSACTVSCIFKLFCRHHLVKRYDMRDPLRQASCVYVAAGGAGATHTTHIAHCAHRIRVQYFAHQSSCKPHIMCSEFEDVLA